MSAAIRSATGLPADILGMNDRGYVRAGQMADIVVFDPNRLIDRATYEEPFSHSEGVRWVLVNGKVAVAEGEVQEETLAGSPLLRCAKPTSGK